MSESQVFNQKTNISNALGACYGFIYYKVNKDTNFEENKNKILTCVFGKDKILSNMQQIRSSSTQQNLNISTPTI